MLILSLIALFAGPLLYQWLRRGGWIARTVETVIVAALVVLVVFLLVPEALRELGLAALALMAAGYLVPGLLELAVRRAAHAFHLLSLFLALAGLVLHAMLDGAGLASGRLEGHVGPDSLGMAIVLHRFGMGLVLWFMVQPIFGRRAAMGVLLLVSAATVLGHALSEPILGLEDVDLVHGVQALVIGTIIHSLVHRSHAHPPHRHDNA